MTGSRTVTALVVGAATLGLSVLLYVYTGSFLFFLLVPFVPFLFRGRDGDRGDSSPVFECSRCDFSTRNPEFGYCPRDGSRLYEQRERKKSTATAQSSGKNRP